MNKKLGKFLLIIGLIVSILSIIASILESTLGIAIFSEVGGFPLGNYLPLIIGILLIVAGVYLYKK